MARFVVIDIETTGHSPVVDDKIIEVGIVIIEEDKISHQYTTLLNPNKTIPPFIENLTGIHDHDVADAPLFKDKAEEITALFHEGYFVAHNVPFDLEFLNEELAVHDLPQLTNPVLDTVELARIFFPQAPSYKLAQLAEYLGISHSDPHRALADAYVTAEVFLKIKAKIARLPEETLRHLLSLEAGLISDLAHLLQAQLKQTVVLSQPPVGITSFQGLAYKDFGSRTLPVERIEMSFGDYLDAIYEQGGTLEAAFAHYEKRLGQREMSEHIFDAFQGKQHALIEAGTGTGKSLAYLLPAIYEAVGAEERILISSYTTQLQSQLLEEEIPLLKQVVPFPFEVALIKGKQHYLSLERFEHELAGEQKDNYDITLTKAMLLVWITETSTGDIDEIQLPSSGYYFYQSISTAAEGQVQPSSPWFQRSFYQQARLRAEEADVLITNHALLCTDIFNPGNLLPDYNKVIIDEAHHLEHTASRHFGLNLDYVTLQYTLNQMGLERDGNWLSKLCTQHPFIRETLSEQQWNQLVTTTKYEIDDLFRALFNYVLARKRTDKSTSDTGRMQYRLQENEAGERKWVTIKDMAMRVNMSLRDLTTLLTSVKESLLTHDHLAKYVTDDFRETILTLHTFIEQIDRFFLTEAEGEHVKWMEIEAYGAKNAVYLFSEPADIAPRLREQLFNKKTSVILTSATLTMKHSFTYIENRLGLHQAELITEQIASPFTYQDQVQLLVPNDFPEINNDHLDDFIFSTCEAIMSLADVTKGKMLVLFTSYDMLRRSHAILRETLDLDQYVLIAQGISSGSRSRLKKNFQTFEKSILLGTSSFWEGVDIPGDDLSCLVIVRLPFQPPNHPVYEAKSEQLQQQGKNPFYELSLPQAVIRFRQGFGRLIRSTSDRGIVFVCDARVVNASYSQFFLDSIPAVPLLHDSTYELIKRAEEWF